MQVHGGGETPGARGLGAMRTTGRVETRLDGKGLVMADEARPGA